MRRTKVVSLIFGTLSVLSLVFTALPAMAAQTFQAYEIGGVPVFTGTGGPGSTITVQAVLVNPSNHSAVIGAKYEWCVITSYTPEGHPLLWCAEALVFNGKGVLFAQGTVDEALIEAYQPQTIPIVAGLGRYTGKTGSETIQQVVFPNELLLTIQLH